MSKIVDACGAYQRRRSQRAIRRVRLPKVGQKKALTMVTSSPRPYADTIARRIADDSGYLVRQRDLVFLRLSNGAIDWMCDQQVPLGMAEQDFQTFIESLADSANLDGIITLEARLKGSSSRFFSGMHKVLPADIQSWRVTYAHEWREEPSFDALATIRTHWNAWFKDQDIPRRRPFDALFLLTLSREPSDYDVQISSDEIANQAYDEFDTARYDYRIHPIYDFLNDDLIEAVLPNIIRWSEAQTERLGRNVTVKIFPGSGPPNKVDSIGDLSSHHRPDDWQFLSLGTKHE